MSVEQREAWPSALPGALGNVDAERALLAAMLVSHAAVADAVQIVRAADFVRAVHGRIFQAALDLYAHGEPTDVVAVTDQLLKVGQLEATGGAAYLHALTSEVSTPTSASYYASIVADIAALRLAADVGSRMSAVATSGAADAGDVLWWAAGQIHDAANRLRNDHRVSLAEALDGAAEEVEAGRGRDGASAEVQTGFGGFDEVTGGLRPGELLVVSGETGAGKSMFALDVVRHASIHQGLTAVMFSLELSRGEIGTRILSAESGVPITALRNGRLDSRSWTMLAAARTRAAAAPLHIDDRMTLSVDDIRLSARQLMSTGGLRLIVIDHVQLLNGDVARELKMLARECRVPVLAVSQLARPAAAPELADVPASVAQNADVVLLVRPNELVLAKHRHGPVGAFPLEPRAVRFIRD